MSEYKVIESRDARNRCQSTTKYGQCNLQSLPGIDRCSKHSGKKMADIARAEQRNYQLTKWHARLEEFAENPQVKSLRDEVGIMRILVENMMNQCKDAGELLLYSGRIADLITRLEKVVSSCHRLEEKTGLVLDKSAVMALGTMIITIIASYVKDEIILESIANQIVTAISKQNNIITVNE